MSAYINKVATALCAALGMPARFASEKPPVSSTLRGSLSEYMKTLSNESLANIAQHAPGLSCAAAQVEIASRKEVANV